MYMLPSDTGAFIFLIGQLLKEDIKMAEKFTYTVSTHSRKEQLQLVDFIAGRKLSIAMTSDYDGDLLMGINIQGDIWTVVPITKKEEELYHPVRHFVSVEDFIYDFNKGFIK